MTLREMLTLLNKIKKCHPEAADAEVWAGDAKGYRAHPKYVKYDQRHKPARIKLEE